MLCFLFYIFYNKMKSEELNMQKDSFFSLLFGHFKGLM